MTSVGHDNVVMSTFHYTYYINGRNIFNHIIYIYEFNTLYSMHLGMLVPIYEDNLLL